MHQGHRTKIYCTVATLLQNIQQASAFHGATNEVKSLPLVSASHKQERVQLALPCSWIRRCVRTRRVPQNGAEAARGLACWAPVCRSQGEHAKLRDRPTSNPGDGATSRSRVLSRRQVVNHGRGGGAPPEEGRKPQGLWCLERSLSSFLRRLRG